MITCNYINIIYLAIYLLKYVGAKEIFEGNVELMLNLIWILIQHFQIGGHGIDTHLLPWVNSLIPELNIKNFTTDWNDGVALCALIDHVQPGLCKNYASLNRKQAYENCLLGIQHAEEKLGVARILAPKDLCSQDVDERSVATYISLFFEQANSLLLEWIQRKLPDRNITNLDYDWSDVRNLACLLDTLVPGLFPNCKELEPENSLNYLTKVIEVGEKRFGVKPPCAFAGGEIDKFSTATYLAQFRYVESVSKDVKCTGSGLGKAMLLGRPVTFEIDARKRETEVADLEITITGSKSEPIKPKVTSNGKGCFSVEYHAWSKDKLMIEIRWKNIPLLPSPFHVNVVDVNSLGFTLKERCVKVGDPIFVKVKAIDNLEEGDVDVFLQGPNGNQAMKADSIEHTGDGTMKCLFKAAQLGKYKLVPKVYEITLQDRAVEVEFADPQKYSVQMQESPLQADSKGRLSLNKSTAFAITASGENFDCLEASIETPGSSEPKPVKILQENGSILGQFTPSETGEYRVLVTCAGEHIHGSPIHLSASDPNRCYLIDKLPPSAQVNAVCTAKLSTKRAGPGEVEVISSQPDILTVKWERDKVEKGNYTIHLYPKMIGESKIDVHFDNVSLLKTPHTVSVCDASKCTVSSAALESGLAKCNEAFDVTVQMKEAGKGTLQVNFILPGRNKTRKTQICDKNGTYNFPLTSYEAGKHFVEILYGGVHIEKSPFTVKVSSDADQFVAKGGGLMEATAHRPATFELIGPQSGLLKESMLDISIKGTGFESKMVEEEAFDPSSEDALVCVTDKSKGFYSVKYSVPDHGNCTIFVKIDDKPIPRSPFNVKVRPAFDPSKCKAYGRAIEEPNSLVLSKSIEFTVDTTTAGTGELTATATHPSQSEIDVVIEKDKSSYYKQEAHVFKLHPKEVGTYVVNVYWNEEPIPKSPFTFEVADPTKVRVLDLPKSSEYVAQVKKPLQFSVDAKDAGKGRLECRVKASDCRDSMVDEMTVEPTLQEDGTLLFNYTPREVGQMQLSLTCNGESILPDAWMCEIANPESTQAIQLQSYGRQSELVKFIVSGLTKNVTKDMSISVTHDQPPHQHLVVQREKQHESSEVHHFTSDQLGKCEVSVKYNGRDIHGSPFHVMIVNPKACIVDEETLPVSVYLHQSKKVLIETSNAGPGEFSFDTDDKESNPKLTCKFSSSNTAVTEMEIEGTEPGKCKLYLKWGGYEIPNMPMELTVYDPQQCQFKCEQIKTGNVKINEKVTVQINTTSAGNCEPEVIAKGSTETEYDVEIEKIEGQEGEYIASFVPHEYGQQTVLVKVGGVVLNNSPYMFNIDDSKEITEEEMLSDEQEMRNTEQESNNEEKQSVAVTSEESDQLSCSKTKIDNVPSKRQAEEHSGQADAQNMDSQEKSSTINDTDTSEVHADKQNDRASDTEPSKDVGCHGSEEASSVQDINLSKHIDQDNGQASQEDNEEFAALECKPSPSQEEASGYHLEKDSVIKHEVEVGIPITFKIVKDLTTCKRRPTLEPVDSTKNYNINVKMEQGEWKVTCTAFDKGDQELRVLCGENELPGSPIKISVIDRKRRSDLNLYKFSFLLTLLLLFLIILAAIGLEIRSPLPDVKPI